jgi:hypothetical protein
LNGGREQCDWITEERPKRLDEGAEVKGEGEYVGKCRGEELRLCSRLSRGHWASNHTASVREELSLGCQYISMARKRLYDRGDLCKLRSKYRYFQVNRTAVAVTVTSIIVALKSPVPRILFLLV